ncbi:uncharacterized protein LOC111340218 [Stylophora pistillata]|uniref:uncharacterized protein LOC111340218 n=1 Tax=Stylophora pistillata TaxID=50429 RepID=UPI000C03CB85|nr:uncharacterized protein LOC111340218 [Stylophora pistillata]XP_022802758.1 uncharacterized protein LOC111340218 [Stylophora pistillata]
MAGRSRWPTSAWYGTQRESPEFTNEVEPLATNQEFIQNLIKLPEELRRLQSENERLKKEANEASRSRVNSPSQATISEKWFKDQLEAEKRQLSRKYKERFLEEQKKFQQQLQANTETLQKNNNELNKNLNQSSKENQDLRKKLKEYEHLLQERSSVSHRYSRDSQRVNYEQQIMKARQVSEGYRRELDRFKERHAAVSERRVRSDQRRTENTLSTNRQSQLESDYVIDFKDGTRVDAIDVMTSKSGRRRGSNNTSLEYVKCCRSACFIFEVAFEVVLRVKESFVKFTSSVMETLAAEAPALGSDTTSFQSKLWNTLYNNPKGDVHATQDVINELMILVKERAKTHDLNSLVQDVKRSISEKWTRHQLQRGSFLLEFDLDLLYRLNGYIKYCTQFAWCTITQVPPLRIDYKTTDYDPKVHEVSQAFSPSEERSPSRRALYSGSRKIKCYLWPTLLDCDGKVIRKGEVLLL